MKFILVVKGGQLTEEFGPTRKGTFTLSNGQDIDHVTFCVPLEAGSSVVATASPTGAPIAAGGGGGGTTIQAGGGASGSLVPIPDGGGPSILLPAASLLLGSGILTYAILRRG
jgi:hypothetical protein